MMHEVRDVEPIINVLIISGCMLRRLVSSLSTKFYSTPTVDDDDDDDDVRVCIVVVVGVAVGFVLCRNF